MLVGSVLSVEYGTIPTKLVNYFLGRAQIRELAECVSEQLGTILKGS